MLAFIIAFLFLPETKLVSTLSPLLDFFGSQIAVRADRTHSYRRQRTLEELDQIFAVPTSRHIAYQCRTWLPWVIKRYILFRRDAQLQPLYRLEGFESEVRPDI